MDLEELRALGRRKAELWQGDGSRRPTAWAERLRGDRLALGTVCRRLERQRGSCSGAEWLLDNRYLAMEALREGERRLGRAGRLPRLCASGGLFRLQALAELLAEGDRLSEEAVVALVEGVQQVTALEEEELSLLPEALAAALGSALRREAEALEEALGGGGSADSFDRSIPGLVRRLARLHQLELGEALEGLSAVDRLFRQDPAGVYSGMDPYSRHTYRARLVKLARQEGLSQQDCARRVLDLARGEGGHIGTWLFPRPLGRGPVRSHSGWYVSLLLSLTTAISIGIGFALGRWWAIFLFLLPVSELVKNTVDLALLHLVKPRPVFRMELRQGVPEQGRTLCVIAALLTGEAGVRELCGKLERYYLSNRRAGEQVYYGLLADLPDRSREMDRGDEALLSLARGELERLSERYGPRFCLFFRRPALAEPERVYRGRERKRGAILALVRYLRGRRGEMELRFGPGEALSDARFLLVLDSDTVLTMDAVTELAGTMLHPLNTPVVDPVRRIVTAGYGILQPRVETELSRGGRTVFARLFSGVAGLDPYGGAVSDLYHDLFDQATFLGKGLLHIDAFLTCMEGRFPRNRILSHDLLEGSYLRCGWVSRTELLDGFPAGALSWLSRYHRWIRGDWQIMGWLGRQVENEGGGRERNPIPMLARWKIFDNLRRSLVPPATLLALLAGLVGTGPLFLSALLAALLAALSQALTAAVELACRRGQGSFRRYHAGIYAGFSGSALRSGAELLFLPVQSWTAAHAALVALWRLKVSRRHLLDWVTSGQSSQGGQGFGRYLLRFWPNLLSGFGVMVFSPFWAGRLLGLAWGVSPLLFCRWGQPERREMGLSRRDRAFLLRECALIWGYYQTWLRPEYHYLIPDNVQSMPDQGAAERTSPTNVGLALLACLAALDLKLTDRDRAVELIRSQLSALEELEKWHGHPYNWYDITTGKPLHPKYVSTVDSGNLCACLIALSGGLRELGEQALSRQTAALAGAMDFSLLYDGRQGLFYIGYEAEEKRYSPSHYDLMASEARTASYLAIARGEVPPRHWRRLSRALVRRNRYTGMASWSGTMFEYLMPRLLLPCCADSLLGETLSFCVEQQRRAGLLWGIPWGVSESGFYDLDPGENYRYKAHGIPSLTVRGGESPDRVIAPYASFLALAVAPGAAAANLRRLRGLGAEGRYGFYEALDFTTARGGSRDTPLIVRSWMAHHLGMSLLAADNCLSEDPMVERFLADSEMAAAEELLMEKIPVGEAVTKERAELSVPAPRRQRTPWRRRGTGFDPACPVWGIAANENYSLALAPGGQGESRTGVWTVLHPEGIGIVLGQGEGREQLFPCPAGGQNLSWEYRSGVIRLRRQGEAMEVEVQALVDRDHTGEQRVITLSARRDWSGVLQVLLRPVLDRWDSYAAHPAFSRMCVESRYVSGGIQFSRRPGRGGLCPVLTALWEPSAGWSTNREQVLTTGALAHDNRVGAVLDPCLALEWPVSLRAGERAEYRIALGVGTAQDSLTAAQTLLSLRRPAPSPLVDRLAAVRGSAAVNEAFVLLSRLRHPGPLGGEGRVEGQQSLWPLGISGDLPIVTCLVPRGETEQALGLAGIHHILRKLGVRFDLVLLLPEQGDYLRPLHTALTRSLTRAGWGDLLDRDGGIRLLSGADRDWQSVLGMAAVNLRPGDRLEQENRFNLPMTPVRWARKPLQPPHWHWQRRGFVLEVDGALPPVRWSHLLVNRHLGWRCDEAGTGHLWLDNAHLGQLTGWENDPIALTGPEELTLCRDGAEETLFARPGGGAVITYGPGYARWERQVGETSLTLTAFVPTDQALRVWKVEAAGARGGDTLRWRLRPRLSQREAHAPWVRCTRLERGAALENPAGTMAGVTLELLGSDEPEGLQWEQGTLTLTFSPQPVLLLTAGVRGRYTPPTPGMAEDLLAVTLRWWAGRTAALSVETPDPALNHYLSFWGPYQVLAGRVLGRSGLYQCGGAVGFRDQLQDVLALLPFCPDAARRQMRDAAAHQFREGDVLHWWHPGGAADSALGVRTRISDDLLWLPYALCRWREETGDLTLLAEEVPYLEGSPLAPGQGEQYHRWSVSESRDSLYRHAVQALECVLNRGLGAHGLCRMGTGDWNDGMNRLGAKGEGESVWLSWFSSIVLSRFARLCGEMGEPERGQRYRTLSRQLARMADRTWDGSWYLRAYDDAGNPVGGQGAQECAIDSIAQSFAVFALGPQDRPRRAVLAAMDQLWDREHQLLRLLRPPFHAASDPGYIKSYPEGLRENGGQYTHAACWMALALLRLGEPDRGYALLRDLLPEHHPAGAYRAEPYVLAGDVYAAEGQQGRGGWSWYTGAAGWYCQTALRDLLGLRLEEGALHLRPRLPSGWKGYQAQWHTDRFRLEIAVERGGREETTLDGAACPGGVDLKTLTGSHRLKKTVAGAGNREA